MQAVSRILLLSLGGFFLIGVSGCKTSGDKDSVDEPVPVKETPSMKIPVGALHVVREDENFVLIRSTRFLQIEPGTDLTVIGSGGVETARLRVSPARKGQFVTADILSGMPKVGDQAIMDYVAETRATSPVGESSGGDHEIQVLE